MTITEMIQRLRALERKGHGALEVRLADWSEEVRDPSASAAAALKLVEFADGSKILMLGEDRTLHGELQPWPLPGKQHAAAEEAS